MKQTFIITITIKSYMDKNHQENKTLSLGYGVWVSKYIYQSRNEKISITI